MPSDHKGLTGWVQHLTEPLVRFLSHPPVYKALKIAGKLIIGYGAAITVLYIAALNSKDNKTLQCISMLGFFLVPLSLFILARRFDKRWKEHHSSRRKNSR